MQKKRASINFEDRAIEINLRPDRKKIESQGCGILLKKEVMFLSERRKWAAWKKIFKEIMAENILA